MSFPEHDPEFPYVVMDRAGTVIAKFATDTLARFYAHESGYKFVSTQPIPDDANYVTWHSTRWAARCYARRIARDFWDAIGDRRKFEISSEEILKDTDGSGFTPLYTKE